MEKTLKVHAIKNGSVIDHLPAHTALRIIKILKLASYQDTITVGQNLPSKKHGSKDIVKIENKELTADQVNQVALLAPLASINIIKNYNVVKKFNVQIPDHLNGVITCPNPKCITNHEKTTSKFLTSFEKKILKLKCYYCERQFNQEEIYDYLA